MAASSSQSANLAVQDILPANFVLASASGNPTATNGMLHWPTITASTNGQATNFIGNVVSADSAPSGLFSFPVYQSFNFLETNTSSSVGTVTNIASAISTTYDPYLTNNPRLYISRLRPGVTLYNSSGTNYGVPFVEYDAPKATPLNPFTAFSTNNPITFVRKFLVPDRRSFENSLSVVCLAGASPTAVAGNAIIISQVFLDSRNQGMKCSQLPQPPLTFPNARFPPRPFPSPAWLVCGVCAARAGVSDVRAP